MYKKAQCGARQCGNFGQASGARDAAAACVMTARNILSMESGKACWHRGKCICKLVTDSTEKLFSLFCGYIKITDSLPQSFFEIFLGLVCARRLRFGGNEPCCDAASPRVRFAISVRPSSRTHTHTCTGCETKAKVLLSVHLQNSFALNVSAQKQI